MRAINPITRQVTEFKRKHVPKIEFHSEISVSDIEDLGENLIDNVGPIDEILTLSEEVKFHNCDDSIKYLFNTLDLRYIA